MGKKRKRSANGHGVENSATQLPSFDESTLSVLTNKIDSSLHNAASSGQDLQIGNISLGRVHRNQNGKPQKTKSYVIDRLSGGKHSAQGNDKEHTDEYSNTAKIQNKRHKGKRDDEQEALLQEILALGGTEDDLDLVAGAPSDDDDTGDFGLDQRSVKDPKLKKELSNFITSLGIGTQSIAEPSLAKLGKDVDDASKNISEPFISKPASAKNNASNSDLQQARTSSQQLKNLMFQPRPDWHTALLLDLPSPGVSDLAAPPELIAELKKYARHLLEVDSELYTSKVLSSTSSHRFLSTIMSSGTLSDKISALTLVVQESPVHTRKSLESLIALARKRSRGQAVIALAAIKDLLGLGAVLPTNRRLKYFENQQGLLGTLETTEIRKWKSGDPLPVPITSAHMISWAFEDWLKETYFEVLKILEVWCNDEVLYARRQAVTYVYELLREKPEQESNLLRLLVNKLGDPDKKIASQTSYLILQLQTTHPLMKLTIIRAIETELLLRPGQSSHAKYYAINTLNQTILSSKEEETACKLLSVYFELFATLLKKADPAKSGSGPQVNRKGQIQGGGGNVGKKAKEKAKKDETMKQDSEETTEKMISAVLTGVNRAFPFAKSSDVTLDQHMNVLFKITHSSNFNTSIQALMLIQQLSSSKNLAGDRFYRTLYESLLDPRLVSSSKHAMYLNLLFRALKMDLNVKRIKAFAKRLLQIVTLHQPPFICGVLYLLRELEVTFPGLSSLLTSPEESDEEDIEVFLDVPEDTTEAISSQKHPEGIQVHHDRGLITQITDNGYDGRKRDPEHSNADRSCLWELLPFIAHFHPSVSLFASRLLNGKEMPAKPDLASHTLIHFLDRFVYRNAKAATGAFRGNSIMQPLAGGVGEDILISKRLASSQHQPLNSESFWKQRADDVAADEVFFHKYFNHVAKGKKPTKQDLKTLGDAEAANSGEGDEENEDEIWQALVESRPEVEGHSEDDSDLEMLDLDDSEDDPEAGSSPSQEESQEIDEIDASGSEDLDINALRRNDGDLSFIGEEIGSRMPAEGSLNADDRTESTAQGTKSMRKRRKLKNLPLFASTEQYAEMLEDDEYME